MHSWALAPFFASLAQAEKSGARRDGANLKKVAWWM